MQNMREDFLNCFLVNKHIIYSRQKDVHTLYNQCLYMFLITSGLGHSRRLIKLVEELACGHYYNRDIICFCAYTHDLGGFGSYAKDNVDHATRSKEVVEEFIQQYDFTDEEIEIIYETILFHHTPCDLKSFEAVLLRDADALEFIGVIGMARDFTRAEKSLKKGISSIQNHRVKSMKNLTLESSKKIAELRIQETDTFIESFFKESYMEF